MPTATLCKKVIPINFQLTARFNQPNSWSGFRTNKQKNTIPELHRLPTEHTRGAIPYRPIASLARLNLHKPWFAWSIFVSAAESYWMFQCKFAAFFFSPNHRTGSSPSQRPRIQIGFQIGEPNGCFATWQCPGCKSEAPASTPVLCSTDHSVFDFRRSKLERGKSYARLSDLREIRFWPQNQKPEQMILGINCLNVWWVWRTAKKNLIPTSEARGSISRASAVRLKGGNEKRDVFRVNWLKSRANS